MTPDILLIDLSLPVMDGVTVLQKISEHRPPVVLAVTAYDGIALRQLLEEVRIDKVFKIPCEIQTIIDSVLYYTEIIPAGSGSIHVKVTELLAKLGIPCNLSGYRQLHKAIMLYISDPTLPLCKELYPMVADSTLVKDGKTAEHTMRLAIESAWANRDKEIWGFYFPKHKESRPKLKLFISRLAQEIRK